MTRYVKYVGTSHVREITKKQWANLDPPVEQVTLRWDAANGWTIPADRITDDAWPYIDADSELMVVDKDYRNPNKDDDTAPADPKLYPPQTTALQAEVAEVEELTAAEEVSGEEVNPPDQESGGTVSVSQGGDGGKD